MRNIAIIPTRSRPKRIPRKYIRKFGGQPLIVRIIQSARNSALLDDVIVLTEDEEVTHISEKIGAKVLKRVEGVDDDSPLSLVIFTAVRELERIYEENINIVLTLLPRSPLLSSNTIDRVISNMLEKSDSNSIISVVNDSNRQDLIQFLSGKNSKVNEESSIPASSIQYRATGSFVCSLRKSITQNSYYSENVHLEVLSGNEGITIINNSDWVAAEACYNIKTIVFVIAGYKEIGTGHIYRGLEIANILIGHDIYFICVEPSVLAYEMVVSHQYPAEMLSLNKCVERIKEIKPDIVINDMLDTEDHYVRELIEQKCFVVNFEDFGTGSHIADLVFNPLHAEVEFRANTFHGKKYFILRDEFFGLPHKQIKPIPENILITFGGTDPDNLTERVLRILIGHIMIPHINVVLGKGYTHLDSLESYILSLPVSDRRCINLVKYANRISSYMEKADIAISSSGRTIFELASIGTPTIVLAHHERELEHNFARLENGLLLLGLGSNVELGALVGAVQMLMHSLSLRKEISQQLYKHDLTKGAERVCGIIMRGVSGEKFTGDYRDYL